MSEPSEQFYVTGGTLRADAPSYVERAADRDLFEGLSNGEYCFVLNTRQMGKSSLMVRTAARLRTAGATIAVLDLTAVGQNLTPEQWYEGLLVSLGQQLHLEDELDDFWLDHERLGPMQRWMEALREVVLPRIGEGGRLVLFIDEIDAVRSLPFSADEFFASIRECYNRRTREPEFARLTYCLLGVATPSDLVSDTRISPFNIGHRIRLADFTLEEAGKLSHGMAGGMAVLRRVLYWTAGQPYLTQRLCRAIAEDTSVTTGADVDRVTTAMFLSEQARENDDHLAFVRNRILRSEVDLAAILDVYSKVLVGKRVADDETDPVLAVLRLSGAARVEKGLLRIRNPIYRQVFGKAWVEQNLPGVERRRQRAAYLQGLFRALSLSGAALAIVVGLAVYGLVQANRANANATRERSARADADHERRKAITAQGLALERARTATEALTEARRQKLKADASARQAANLLLLANKRLAETSLARRSEAAAKRDALRYARLQSDAASEARFQADVAETASYVPTMSLIQREWDNNNLGRILDLLRQTRANRKRGPEWDFWNRLSRLEETTSKGHTGRIYSVSFSADGRRFVTGSEDKTARVWDTATGREALCLRGHNGSIRSACFSPEGSRILTASEDGSARIWDGRTGELQRSLVHPSVVWCGTFSPDGKLALTGDESKTGRLWEVDTGKEVRVLQGHTAGIWSVAISSDGRQAITCGYDKTARLWDLTSGEMRHMLNGHEGFVWSAAFSGDGKRAITGSDDGTARIWETASGKELLTLRGHDYPIWSVAFSPDGKQALTGSWDRSARRWNAETGRPLQTYRGHTGYVVAAFSPAGGRLVTASWDRTAKVWDLERGRESLTLGAPAIGVTPSSFSRDGSRLLTGGSDGTATLWDTDTGLAALTLRGHANAVYGTAISSDGRWLATASHDKTAKIWSARTGELLQTLRGHDLEVSSVAFSPDSRTLVTGSFDATARVWEAASGRLQRILKGHTSALYSVRFSPDGRRVLTSGYDRMARVWSSASGAMLLTLTGHEDNVTSAAFSPDGRRIVTASYDGGVRLWDAVTGKEKLNLKGHTRFVLSASFSPDGKRVITGSQDGTARFWDPQSGQETMILNSETRYVDSAVISPDGKCLATGLGGVVRLWRMTGRFGDRKGASVASSVQPSSLRTELRRVP